MEAQKRMRNARVCVIRFAGMAVEVVKNLVLAGIGELTILEDKKATDEDLGYNFFLTAKDVGALRSKAAIPQINALNPNVKVTTESDMKLALDSKFLSSFQVVICSDCPFALQAKINDACRNTSEGASGPVFFSSLTFGISSYFFKDVGPSFKYSVKKKNMDDGTTETHMQEISGTKLSDILASLSFDGCKSALGRKGRRHLQLMTVIATHMHSSTNNNEEKLAVDLKSLQKSRSALGTTQFPDSKLPDSALSDTSRQPGLALAPVLSISGGMLAQETLKIISRVGKPYKNSILFDGFLGGAIEFGLQDKKVVAPKSTKATKKRKAESVILL